MEPILEAYALKRFEEKHPASKRSFTRHTRESLLKSASVTRSGSKNTHHTTCPQSKAVHCSRKANAAVSEKERICKMKHKHQETDSGQWSTNKLTVISWAEVTRTCACGGCAWLLGQTAWSFKAPGSENCLEIVPRSAIAVQHFSPVTKNRVVAELNSQHLQPIHYTRTMQFWEKNTNVFTARWKKWNRWIDGSCCADRLQI